MTVVHAGSASFMGAAPSNDWSPLFEDDDDDDDESLAGDSLSFQQPQGWALAAEQDEVQSRPTTSVGLAADPTASLGFGPSPGPSHAGSAYLHQDASAAPPAAEDDSEQQQHWRFAEQNFAPWPSPVPEPTASAINVQSQQPYNDCLGQDSQLQQYTQPLPTAASPSALQQVVQPAEHAESAAHANLVAAAAGFSSASTDAAANESAAQWPSSVPADSSSALLGRNPLMPEDASLMPTALPLSSADLPGDSSRGMPLPAGRACMPMHHMTSCLLQHKSCVAEPSRCMSYLLSVIF